jgi:hypothetical protein
VFEPLKEYIIARKVKFPEPEPLKLVTAPFLQQSKYAKYHPPVGGTPVIDTGADSYMHSRTAEANPLGVPHVGHPGPVGDKSFVDTWLHKIPLPHPGASVINVRFVGAVIPLQSRYNFTLNMNSPKPLHVHVISPPSK